MDEDTRDREEELHEHKEQSEWEEWRKEDYAQRYKDYRSGLQC